MKKTLCLCLIFQILQTSKLSSFDPSTFDYCSITCNGMEHSACKCAEKKAENAVVSDEDITNFRKVVLEHHNKFRNKIASGEENGCPKAANMMVLNYDPELEYIAKCHSKAMPPIAHDKCRKKHNHERNAGQNLYTSSSSDGSSKDYNDIVGKAVTGWYNEVHSVEDKEELLKRFSPGPTYMHFTAVVWAKVTHVGCVMVHVTGKSIVLCNYAYDSDSDGDSGGGNVMDYPVYEFGEPCSKCPNKEKCNKKYPALCGTIEGASLIPTKEAEKKDNKDKKGNDKKDDKKKNNEARQTEMEEKPGNDTSPKSTAFSCVQIDVNLLFICILSIIWPNLF